MPARREAGNPRRSYRSPARREQARRTRAAVLAAAHDTFVANGYAATTLRTVADAAGVSVPTVEQAFGTKRNLLKTVVDVTKAGDDEPVPMLERASARAAVATGTAEDFLAILAAEIGVVSARMSAISTVVAHAAAGDRQIAELAVELDGQRRTVAAWILEGLRERGRLRPELDVDRAVDILWVLLDPVVHRRLTHDRGWSVEAFTRWFEDAVVRLLLTPPSPVHGDPPRSPAGRPG
jgi:AcrR family transcriptional regulator